jgi:hypothetical protein
VDGTCPATAYDAEGQCLLSDGYDDFWCILVCDATSDCPPEQQCVDTGQDVSICL